jgi:hypothetical protein
MENIYYIVNFYESCSCCGHDTSFSATDYKSFSEARDSILNTEDADLTTNDPIAKYYLDDDRIIYKGE